MTFSFRTRLLLAAILASLSTTAYATPLELQYTVTPQGSVFRYDFTLINNNNDGTWVPGQGWGFIAFADGGPNGTTPLSSWQPDLSTFPAGPFTGTGTVGGAITGPFLGPSTSLRWIPGFVGDSISWSGTSTAELGKPGLTAGLLGSPSTPVGGQATIDFGSIREGTSSSRTVEVRNDESGIRWSTFGQVGSPTPPRVSLEDAIRTNAPGGSAPFTTGSLPGVNTLGFTGSGGSFSLSDGQNSTATYSFTPDSSSSSFLTSTNQTISSSQGNITLRLQGFVYRPRFEAEIDGTAAPNNTSTDLGEFDFGDETIIPFKVTNNANIATTSSLARLRLGGFEFTGPDADNFTLLDASMNELTPGNGNLNQDLNGNDQSVDYFVKFLGETVGDNQATLTFFTDQGAANNATTLGEQFTFDFTASVNMVPEPASLFVWATIGVGLIWRSRRRRLA